MEGPRNSILCISRHPLELIRRHAYATRGGTMLRTFRLSRNWKLALGKCRELSYIRVRTALAALTTTGLCRLRWSTGGLPSRSQEACSGNSVSMAISGFGLHWRP